MTLDPLLGLVCNCLINIFNVVIPKEGLEGTIPANPSFGMTSSIELYSIVVWYTDF